MKNKSISQGRINKEIQSMQKEKLSYLWAQPLQNDIFTWHFTIQGPQQTDFHEGLYHGQIFLPFQYPFKPPDIVFMNSNGRFQISTKICLTITQYHPEEWNSAWTIRTMLEAVVSLFNQNIQGVGYVESNSQTRKYLAKQSHHFVCAKCGPLKEILKPREQMQCLKKQKIKAEKQEDKEDKEDMKLDEMKKQKQKVEMLRNYESKKRLIKKEEDFNDYGRKKNKQKQEERVKKVQQLSSEQDQSAEQNEKEISFYQLINISQYQLEKVRRSVKWIDDY